MTLSWYTTVVDASDPGRLAAFWAEALHWTLAYEQPNDVAIEAPDDPDDRIPAIVFVLSAEAKTSKNRLHLDLNPADQDAEVQRLLALGATRADVGQREVGWVVLADPEGNNEFCILEPQKP